MTAKIMPRITIITLALLLSACATDSELQQNGTGSDEMRPSPCACDPVPYQYKTYTWDHV